MKLSEITIAHLRNIDRAHLPDLADINIIAGENGAGKTSVLEAIHMLALARSFRSTGLQPVIQRDADACTVFGRLTTPGQPEIPVGVHRRRRGGFRIKLDGEEISSVVRLAQILPVQIINASSYQLLDGGPKQRRQFLDWGVFHVEQSFYANWQRAQKAVKQRNAILRSGRNYAELAPWDRELVEATAVIHSARACYVELFGPVFHQLLAKLIDIDGLELAYRPGWDKTLDFSSALAASASRDRARGLTHCGPHRADLKISVHGSDAGQILSRGQQKLVVSALRLAQTQVMQSHTGRRCVFLIDDLPAEMDKAHQQKLCSLLGDFDMQLFLTCISPDELLGFDWPKGRSQKLFHVKQGEIECVQR